MYKEPNYMTEVLQLTLKIIYLLTGEDYTVVKKKAGHNVTPNSHPRMFRRWSMTHSHIMDPPPPSLATERNNKEILDVTQKITELLTGEVPIRCQDVSVYFSMEEWEYIEGHKDLYKDVMKENRPPLTSPDGSSNRNPPERCPRPLYSRDSTQEHHKSPQDVQGKMLVNIKAEVKEEVEELYLISEELCKEEAIPLEICTDGRYRSYKTVEPEEDDITSNTLSKKPITFFSHPVHPGGDPSPDPSTWVGFPPYLPPPDPHQTVHTWVEPAPSPHRGECYTSRAGLIPPLRNHTEERPYSCSQCGKRFARKFCLITHEKIHMGLKPYSCPECGKCFSRKSSLITHHRVHTGEKPFTCAACGKCFSQRSHLIGHERTHTGVKPFSCPLCGKCYSRKADLADHHRTHTGVKPYSCTTCGKSFNNKSNFHTHRKIHTTHGTGKDRRLQQWGKMTGLLQ